MRISLVVFILQLNLLLWSCDSGETTPTKSPSTPTAKTESLSSTELRKGVDRFPDSPALRMRLVASLEKEGQFTSALKQLDSMITRDSVSAFLRYRRAQLQLSLGDTQTAMNNLATAARLDPDRASIQLELGSLYADRSDPRLLPLADSLIARTQDPDIQSRTLLLKGIYYSNLGDKPMAMKQYDESIRRNYTFLDAFIEKGIVQYEMKKYGDALRTFEKGLAIKPSEAELYLWKGKCQQAMGQEVEAMDNYRKCLGLDDSLKEAAERLSALEHAK
jgi:tetratricopeptide (TPR) repeat protein